MIVWIRCLLLFILGLGMTAYADTLEVPAYFTFHPRPDQPERYDQQSGFYNSKTKGVAFLVGGNGAGTTEVAMAKIAKFVLNDQRPPRPDTPFWIIGNSYQQIGKTAWKEKLSPDTGHGHIPPGEIDRDRIRWYRESQGWPYEVPLKPWPGDKKNNWTLVFKSYEQGRAEMQGESIGGFCFVEQFPWGLLEEVLRGCREYSFPGSKFCEFTPVDPALSVQVEEMAEDPSRIPPGWEFYRANTECALDAGHVTQDWFDQFFGMVSDDMKATRMIGAYASYEGSIYQGFNPLVHLVGDDEIFPGGRFPIGVHHRRGIDWGQGVENAQVCLWGYFNSLRQWFIYDEYWSTSQEMTVPDHLAEIADRWPWPNHRLEYGVTWADPAAADCIRIAQRFNTIYPDRENFNLQGAKNAVIEGIDHVKWLLQSSVCVDGLNMQPRLFIHKQNCPNLAREMRTYRWKRGPKTGINPRDGAPEPLKQDDHAVDTLRYMTFSEAASVGAPVSSQKRPSPAASKSVRGNFGRKGWQR